MQQESSRHASSVADPGISVRLTSLARWAVGVAVIGVIAAVSTVGYFKLTAIPPRQLLRAAGRALTAGDFSLPERTAESIPVSSIEFNEAMLIAGEAATKQNRYEQAIGHYARISSRAGDQTATARVCAGDLLLQLG